MFTKTIQKLFKYQIKIKIYFICICFSFLYIFKNAEANNLPLIQDAEIETVIKKWAEPILIAANLNPESINFYFINNNSINAFVAGGQNIFINIGLIIKAEDHNALLGVIAHEAGHISGGHLIQTNKAINRAQNTTIIATLITAGLMAISHSKNLNIKGISKLATIGPSIAERNFYKFSRENERFADSAAIKYMKAVNRPIKPLANLLNKIGKQELLHENRQDPYLRTHPISRDRIAQIMNETKNEIKSDEYRNTQEKIQYNRIVAKIIAFTNPPGKTLLLYPKNNFSIEARYARSIAYLRLPDFDKGIKEISSLIKEYPEDPFFPELLGQMYFENGELFESIQMYERAINKIPNNPIILLALSRAQVEFGNTEEILKAKSHLKSLLNIQEKNIAAWRLLSIVEARLDNIELAQLASAESYFLLNEYRLAIQFAEKARELFKKNSPNDIRAQDIIYFSNEKLKSLQNIN